MSAGNGVPNIPTPMDLAMEEYRASVMPKAPAPIPPGSDRGENSEAFYRPDWKRHPLNLDVSALPAAGARLVSDLRVTFPVRSLQVDNLSGYRLRYNNVMFIAPNIIGVILPTPDQANIIRIDVDAAGAAGEIRITLHEERLAPVGGVLAQQGSGLTPIGAAAAAATQVTVAAGPGATALLAANPLRTGALFRNLDGAITLWVGPPGVTNLTGMQFGPGESLPVTARSAWSAYNVGAGTPIVAVIEEHN